MPSFHDIDRHRLPRYVIPGQPQHIIQRGNNRQRIFAADADYSFFRDTLVQTAMKHGLAIRADVWMTNQIHPLATPGLDHSISKVFQLVERSYVQYFNFIYRRSDTLRQGHYRAAVVDSDRYLLTLMRYIELNPVRAGMVVHPRDYLWSSYRRDAQGESGLNVDWLTAHESWGRNKADRQSAYRQLFQAAITGNDLAEIRECTHKGRAPGGERFREHIKALRRRATSKGVGRPKKEKNRV